MRDAHWTGTRVTKWPMCGRSIKPGVDYEEDLRAHESLVLNNSVKVLTRPKEARGKTKVSNPEEATMSLVYQSALRSWWLALALLATIAVSAARDDDGLSIGLHPGDPRASRHMLAGVLGHQRFTLWAAVTLAPAVEHVLAAPVAACGDNARFPRMEPAGVILPSRAVAAARSVRDHRHPRNVRRHP
eukprot:CAMPEP_0195102734 /NCGR_PEP_ID=MMETSP0448-20130528/69155_1 /TAXON_ID=66468 /ORGANISM="Heterocapsa triquestra, Strain CCMP 448" /LENGTH=186 /DNA_ID=CAMNT_0040138281 /DNA_START=101 /DNA_END=663 /DNA_ORIENTATION=+